MEGKERVRDMFAIFNEFFRGINLISINDVLCLLALYPVAGLEFSM